MLTVLVPRQPSVYYHHNSRSLFFGFINRLISFFFFFQDAWHSYVFFFFRPEVQKQNYSTNPAILSFSGLLSNMVDCLPAAPHAIDNLKAKLKAVFKKKGESKPTETAAGSKADATKPAEAAAPAAAPTAATTTAATSGPTETKLDAPVLAGKASRGAPLSSLLVHSIFFLCIRMQ